ncbi:MAG: flagellar hook assembly protein FlgD [Ramlibacter sp.]
MAVSTVNNTTAPANAGAAALNSVGGASAAEQQDRFMKLLVAQMKNQDPLSPMDNAQMTSQIAQINMVGGIEKLNGTVESLLASFTALQAQSATQLPGRDVLVSGNALSLADGVAKGGVELARAADTVNVDILDAGGNTVRTLALGASGTGVRGFSWDGLRHDGKPAPEGSYRLRVAASAAGKPVDATTLAAARVQSVSNSSAGVQVDLGSAGIRPYADVKSFL